MKSHRSESILSFLTPMHPVFALIYYCSLTRRLNRVIEGLKSDRLTYLSLTGLLVVGIVSSLRSPDVTEGLLNSLIMPVFICIFALGRWGVHEPQRFLRLVTLGAGFLGLVVILGRLFQANIWWGNLPVVASFWGGGRGNIFGVSDNLLAAVLEVGVVGGLGWFMYHRTNRWLYLLSTGSALGGIMTTMSRGSMVGTLAAVILLVVINSTLARKHWKAIILLGLVVSVSIAAVPVLSQRVSSILDVAAEGKNRGRIEIWTAGCRMLRDYPLLGVGPGLFGEFYPQYSVPDTIHPEARSPHSLYLFILTGWGLIGFAIFAVWAVHAAIRPVFMYPSVPRKIALTMIVSFFVHTLVNDLFVAHVPLIMGIIGHPDLDRD